MDKIRLLLILITLATIAGPVMGIMVLYRNNLMGLVVPPELTEIAGGTFLNNGSLEPPKFMNSQYDLTSRTVTLTFNFTNPLNFDLTIKTMSANIECTLHKLPLGHATIKDPVVILPNETAIITVLGNWTEDAISHFQSAHADAKSIDVDLVGLKIDVSGINIQMKERINVPNVPIT